MGLNEDFEQCIANGGVALFPADTVYGLACDPNDAGAIARLYALKGRPADKPAAVMAFSADSLHGLGPRTMAAVQQLLPGALTVLVASDAFPLAGGNGVLGLRVPDMPLLAGVRTPVLQTSANHAGGPDARTLDEVPEDIRAGADLVIDGGELPGVPSTVVDLSRYEETGEWTVLREGAVPRDVVSALLGGSAA